MVRSDESFEESFSRFFGLKRSFVDEARRQWKAYAAHRLVCFGEDGVPLKPTVELSLNEGDVRGALSLEPLAKLSDRFHGLVGFARREKWGDVDEGTEGGIASPAFFRPFQTIVDHNGPKFLRVFDSTGERQEDRLQSHLGRGFDRRLEYHTESTTSACEKDQKKSDPEDNEPKSMLHRTSSESEEEILVLTCIGGSIFAIWCYDLELELWMTVSSVQTAAHLLIHHSINPKPQSVRQGTVSSALEVPVSRQDHR